MYRIVLKICTITYQALSSKQPACLHSLCQTVSICIIKQHPRCSKNKIEVLHSNVKYIIYNNNNYNNNKSAQYDVYINTNVQPWHCNFSNIK